MNTLNKPKKASIEGWHNADIVAALRKSSWTCGSCECAVCQARIAEGKTGWTLRGLSKHHQLTPCTLSNALHVPYPNGERLIAQAIGVPPWEIWPERYGQDGLPNRGRRPQYLQRGANPKQKPEYL